MKLGTRSLLHSAKSIRKSMPKNHWSSYRRKEFADEIRASRKISRRGTRNQYMTDPRMI